DFITEFQRSFFIFNFFMSVGTKKGGGARRAEEDISYLSFVACTTHHSKLTTHHLKTKKLKLCHC
ncbi:hypothetical protein D0T85_18795, partial [Bacteroides sp. 519]|nr:hypothetical protein [Bacteroides sp. 519]